jgi:hypothetical protein
MLAALRFLIQYLRFWAVPIADTTTNHLDYTDSQSLLKRLASSQKRYYQSPGACLKSEFDLESAILAAFKELPLKITRHHVAAHQDDRQPNILRLRWKAQLNIICDRLASRQLEISPVEPKVIPNPSCNAYIQVQGESVTGQIRKTLFDAAARPRIKAYLLKRYTWDDTIFDSVDWDATHSCLRSLSSSKHHFVTKFCFQQLPLGIRLRQRNALAPANCPACKDPLEDDWHWITCPARAAWRSQQANLFSSRLDSLKTQPGIKLIILRAFKSLLLSGACNFDDAVFSHDESLIVTSQAAIGWRHLVYGRCSSEWARLQEHHARAKKLDPKLFTGKSWTRKVIRYFWYAFQDLWKVRNTDLHGTTFAEGEPAKRAHLTPIVQHLYDHIHQLAPSDRVMLHKPIADRLKQPISVLATWLSIVQPAFDKSRIRDDHPDLDQEAADAEDAEIELAIAQDAAQHHPANLR